MGAVIMWEAHSGAATLGLKADAHSVAALECASHIGTPFQDSRFSVHGPTISTKCILSIIGGKQSFWPLLGRRKMGVTHRINGDFNRLPELSELTSTLCKVERLRFAPILPRGVGDHFTDDGHL